MVNGLQGCKKHSECIKDKMSRRKDSQCVPHASPMGTLIESLIPWIVTMALREYSQHFRRSRLPHHFNVFPVIARLAGRFHLVAAISCLPPKSEKSFIKRRGLWSWTRIAIRHRPIDRSRESYTHRNRGFGTQRCPNGCAQTNSRTKM